MNICTVNGVGYGVYCGGGGVFEDWAVARLCLCFSMISDCGYGHFCYMAESALLGIWDGFMCVVTMFAW